MNFSILFHASFLWEGQLYHCIASLPSLMTRPGCLVPQVATKITLLGKANVGVASEKYKSRQHYLVNFP